MPASNLLVYHNVPKVENPRVCPVCSDEAPPGEVHHPHYGAICCYGCKAFFRRANQSTRKKPLKCKRDGNCVIFPKCKQHCKKCRFDKCVANGMDPKWVMSNDEKRVRFKKYFEKKDRLTALGLSGRNSASARARSRRAQNRPHPYERSRNDTTGSDGSFGSAGSSNTMSPESIDVTEPQDLSLRPMNQGETSVEMSSVFIPAHWQTLRESLESKTNEETIDDKSVCDVKTTPVLIDLRKLNSVTKNEERDNAESDNSSKSDDASSQRSSQLQNDESRLFIKRRAWDKSASELSERLSSEEPDQDKNITAWQKQDVVQIWNDKNASFERTSALIGKLGKYLPFMTEEHFTNNLICYPVQTTTTGDTEGEPTPSTSSAQDRTPGATAQPPPRVSSGRSQMSSILDAFTLTTGKLSLNKELIQDIIESHQYQKPFDKSTLIRQLSLITSTLAEFAASQPTFATLNKEDQVALLKSNIPLYLQYILARYFCAETGQQQVSWILEGNCAVDNEGSSANFQKISLRDFNTSVDMFSTSESLEIFSHLAEKISVFYPFPQYCNGLIANMLLYYIDESLLDSLNEPEKILTNFREAREILKAGFSHYDPHLKMDPCQNITPLVNTLKKMKNIFGACKVQNCQSSESVSIPRPPPFTFCSGEERWMSEKFREFQQQFQSVTPDRGMVRDVLGLLQFGTPVSEVFMPSCLQMNAERCLRVLNAHPEFRDLPKVEQEALLRKNQPSANALAVVLVENMSSGKEQLKRFMGILNSQNDEWERSFDGMCDLNALTSSNLGRPELHLGKWDESTLICYHQLSKDIKDFCRNDQNFQLCTLMTLLDTEGLPQTPSMLAVNTTRQIYLKFFQRKLTAAGCTFVDYSHFKSTLKKIKVFATLLENFFL